MRMRSGGIAVQLLKSQQWNCGSKMPHSCAPTPSQTIITESPLAISNSLVTPTPPANNARSPTCVAARLDRAVLSSDVDHEPCGSAASAGVIAAHNTEIATSSWNSGNVVNDARGRNIKNQCWGIDVRCIHKDNASISEPRAPKMQTPDCHLCLFKLTILGMHIRRRPGRVSSF